MNTGTVSRGAVELLERASLKVSCRLSKARWILLRRFNAVASLSVFVYLSRRG